MFTAIGMLAVTLLFGYLAVAFLSIVIIPAEMPTWARVVFIIFAILMVVCWWFTVGVHISINVS